MMKRLFFFITTLFLVMAVHAQDDMYFTPTKESIAKAKEDKLKAAAQEAARRERIMQTAAQQRALHEEQYWSGINKDVDEYNRRVSSIRSYRDEGVTGNDSVASDVIAFNVGKETTFDPNNIDTLYNADDDYKCSRCLTRFDDYCYRFDPWYYDRWYWGYSPYFTPWYARSYCGWYYWDRWGYCDPWYYNWCYDPWFYGPWYRPIVVVHTGGYIGGSGGIVYRRDSGAVYGRRGDAGFAGRLASYNRRDNIATNVRDMRRSRYAASEALRARQNESARSQAFDEYRRSSSFGADRFSGGGSFGTSRGGGGGFGGGTMRGGFTGGGGGAHHGRR